MPQTILPISVGQMVLICIFILIILFVITKAKGIKGSWSKKSEIDPFIIILYLFMYLKKMS